MNHFHSLLANISDLPWVAIISISGGFLVSIVVPLIAMYFQHQKRQLWHETARIALEKGQPMPPLTEESKVPDEAIRETLQHDREQRNDLRSGLVLIGVGVGLYFFFSALGVEALRYVGAIPGCIGVALLLFALITRIFPGKRTPPADRP